MEFFAGVGLRKNKESNEKEAMKEMMDMNTIQTVSKLNTELRQKDQMISGLTRAIAQMNIEIQNLKQPKGE